MTITPSTGTFEESDVLTCSANGYNPTYTWTGTAGVNGAVVSETGDTYTLPEGPFNVTCTANVSQLPAPCHASATVSDNAYSKYESNITIATVLTIVIIHACAGPSVWADFPTFLCGYHSYQLPHIEYNLHKNSFINRYLFNYR